MILLYIFLFLLISLCNNSANSWFQHTNDWLNYTLAMRESGSDDLSFEIMENNKLVAFAPLVKEYIYEAQEKDEFSMAGFPIKLF